MRHMNANLTFINLIAWVNVHYVIVIDTDRLVVNSLELEKHFVSKVRVEASIRSPTCLPAGLNRTLEAHALDLE